MFPSFPPPAGQPAPQRGPGHNTSPFPTSTPITNPVLPRQTTIPRFVRLVLVSDDDRAFVFDCAGPSTVLAIPDPRRPDEWAPPPRLRCDLIGGHAYISCMP